MTQLQLRTGSAPVPALRPQRRGELIEVRRPATAAPMRRALDLYPDYELDVLAMKRVGIASVHGFFPLAAWQNVCASTRLYMLPMAGVARGNLRDIRNAVSARRSRLSSIGQIMETPESTALKVLNEMSVKRALLPCIWPDYREPPDGRDQVGFDYPHPPQSVFAIAQKARLAGYEPMIAIPASAIRVNDLSALVATQPEPAPVDRDPIVYAVRGNTAVVITHYGDIEAGAMAALVAVLNEMDVQL